MSRVSPVTRGWRLAIVVIVCAMSVCAISPVSADTGERTTAGAATFTAKVRSRHNASWEYYRDWFQYAEDPTVAHTYDPAVLTAPDVVGLNACATPNAGESVFKWAVQHGGGDVTVTQANPSSCTASFPAATEGTYEISLTAEHDGVTSTSNMSKQVERALVVSLGDSMSSGEGNPDGFASWADGRCHRSRKSAPAIAARKMENTSRSVTFVAFGCSGAEIDTGVVEPYNGINPAADCAGACTGGIPALLAPQIDAAAALLCGGNTICTTAPDVDAVFVSAGINDTGFSKIIKACMDYDNCGDDTDPNGWFDDGIDDLGPGYRTLARRLRSGPFAGARVFILGFPDDPFGGGGCVTPFGLINEPEAEALHRWGERLNRTLRYQAAKHDWTFVEVASRFSGHGYCEPLGKSYFVSLTSSLVNELDYHGTMHPNGKGHAAIADELRTATETHWVRRERTGYVKVDISSITVTLRGDPDEIQRESIRVPINVYVDVTHDGFKINTTRPKTIVTEVSLYDPTELDLPVIRTNVYNTTRLELAIQIPYTTSLPDGTLPIIAAGPVDDGDPGPPGDEDPEAPEPPPVRSLTVDVFHTQADNYGMRIGGSCRVCPESGPRTVTSENEAGSITMTYSVFYQPGAAGPGN